MRRIFIIIAIVFTIILVGLVGYIAYTKFFKATPATVGNTDQPSLPQAGQVPGTQDPGTITQPPEIGNPPPVIKAVSERLVQISRGPVVFGESIVDTKETASSSARSLVRFIERRSGNVYSYDTSTKALVRTNNRTIPGIQSASWLPDGSMAYIQYLSGSGMTTIDTYALPSVNDTAASSSKQGFVMPRNISSLSVSSTSVFFLATGVNGTIATTERPDGSKSASVFTTPLTAIRASLIGKTGYLAYSKPNALIPGSVFIVDPTGHFSKLIGPLLGITALGSPTGKWVLVSYVLSQKMRVSLINVSTHEILPLPIATITDKCVWSIDETAVYCGVPSNPPYDAVYPDDWYQGAVSFSDQIWKINVNDRYAQLVLDFNTETKSELDAVNLTLGKEASHLVFVNKNDGSLWSFSL